MDTATMPPGQVRLFDVDPGNDPMNVIVADPFRVVLATNALAAAVYSAGAEATRLGHPVWITSPDRWHATVTHIAARTDIGWHVDGSAHAPTDAIRRALTHINQQPQTGENQ